MAREHQRANGCRVAGPERDGGGPHPLVLGDDVARAGLGSHRADLAVAKRAEAEPSSRCRALGPTSPVRGAGQRARPPAVDREHPCVGGQGDGLHLEGPAIDQEGMTRAPVHGGELVHATAVDPGRGDLGVGCEGNHSRGIRHRTGGAREREDERDREGGARGEARAHRHRRRDRHVERGQRSVSTRNRVQRAAHESRPRRLDRGGRRGSRGRDLGDTRQLRRPGPYDRSPDRGGGAHRAPPVYGHREHEALVVVGVVPDQVDTARRSEHLPSWPTSAVTSLRPLNRRYWWHDSIPDFWAIAKRSWAVLKSDKSLAWFPGALVPRDSWRSSRVFAGLVARDGHRRFGAPVSRVAADRVGARSRSATWRSRSCRPTSSPRLVAGADTRLQGGSSTVSSGLEVARTPDCTACCRGRSSPRRSASILNQLERQGHRRPDHRLAARARVEPRHLPHRPDPGARGHRRGRRVHAVQGPVPRTWGENVIGQARPRHRRVPRNDPRASSCSASGSPRARRWSRCCSARSASRGSSWRRRRWPR